MRYEVLNANKLAAKKENSENYILLNYKNGWHRLCTDVVKIHAFHYEVYRVQSLLYKHVSKWEAPEE